jgi:hypothetical protein
MLVDVLIVSIILVIILRRMRGVWNMSFCRGGGEKINAYRFFSWKTLMKEAAWNR